MSLGSNLRSGHMLKNVPAFLTGNISNKIKHGQHIEMPKDTALCNLWLTMLKLCDVPVESFGDGAVAISGILQHDIAPKGCQVCLHISG